MPGEHDKFGAPYRPPCQGWPDAKYRYLLGPMWNHFRTGEAAVQKYLNLTTVPNPICEAYWSGSGPWPANVPPYTRPDCTSPHSSAGRADYPGDAGYCDAPSTKMPCGPWLDAQFASCAGGDTTIDLNCYSIVPGEKLDLSFCRKLGFKNVQARKFWHGRFGFEDTDAHDCGVDPTGCGEAVPALPQGTKYRTQRIKAVYKRTETITCGFEYNYTLDITFTVDQFGGIITQTVNEWTHDDTHGIITDKTGDYPNDLLEMFYAAKGMVCAQTHDEEWNPDPTPGPNAGGCESSVNTISWDHSNTHCLYQDITVDTGCTTVCLSDEETHTGIDQTNTKSFESWLSDPYDASDLVLEVIALLAYWDLSDDATYPFRVDAFTTVAPLVEYDSVPGAIGPQCGAQAEDDKEIHEPGWVDPNAGKFTGDILGQPLPHPGMVLELQTSGIGLDNLAAPRSASNAYQLSHYKVTIAAGGVELWDGDGHTLMVGVEGVDYTYDSSDGTITILPGSLLLSTHTGSELPLDNSGSDYSLSISYTFAQILGGHFDRKHETWHIESATPYRYGWGAYSGYGYPNIDPTDSAVPRCATHWTQNDQAQSLPHGAFQKHFAGGLLWMQKWAEITTQRPAQNWFGPCGAQRFEIDAAKSECVTSAAGSPPVLTLGTGGGATFTAGNKAVYFDGTNAAYHTVSSVSGDDVHLSAKIADLDADMFAGGPLLGVVKWPNAWSICGRVAVAGATELSGTVTVDLAEPAPYLVTGDAVDFTDGNDSTTDANKTVTVVSETQFTFAGSVPTGTFVKSHSAPAYWFNDTNPKGDYLYFTWGINNRDYLADTGLRTHQASHGMPRNVSAFSVTAGCVPFTPCCPSVLCVSPNYDGEDPETIDSFTNGITLGFADFTPDDRYGSAWQAAFRQVMDDLWWHPPPHPCSTGVSDDPYEAISTCTMVEDLTEAATLPCPANTCDGAGGGGKFYYAHRRVVEARMTVPTWSGSGSAPALPTGVFINYLSLADLDTAGSPPDGLVAAPPEDVGGLGDDLDQPNIVGYDDAPWRLYIDEQYCVCNNGRFAADYLAGWVICGLVPV